MLAIAHDRDAGVDRDPSAETERSLAPEAARIPTGCSVAIQEVNRLIRKVAAHDSSVLILGESGTGKEVAARAIHESSPRRNRPFVALNCGAIPAELLESELFGHEKGAFTGAVAPRKGRFEVAEGGTLFLDEIGDMSFPMQVKLLRVLQERVFERIGNHVPIRCNVRIIAATHRDLEDSITRGVFRQDLFYRLNVFPIEMPSLRDRMEDLPALVEQFARQNACEGRGLVRLSEPALDALTQHPFPGNVRELSNLVERLSILCAERVVDVEDLPVKYRPPGWMASACQAPVAAPRREPSGVESPVVAAPRAVPAAAVEPSAGLDDGAEIGLFGSDEQRLLEGLAQLPPEGCDLRSHLFTIERNLIRQALERTDGTVAHAARLLRLRRTTLVEKLRKFGMLTAEVTSET